MITYRVNKISRKLQHRGTSRWQGLITAQHQRQNYLAFNLFSLRKNNPGVLSPVPLREGERESESMWEKKVIKNDPMSYFFFYDIFPIQFNVSKHLRLSVSSPEVCSPRRLWRCLRCSRPPPPPCGSESSPSPAPAPGPPAGAADTHTYRDTHKLVLMMATYETEAEHCWFLVRTEPCFCFIP